jgi:type VI secretion system protein VasG
MEKAHRDVHEIFYQVFDKGMMEDGEGRLVDFKNTVILMTTNVGSDLVHKMCKDPELRPEPEGLLDGLRDTMLDTFPAALLGRLVEVPYYPITEDVLKDIIDLQLGRIQERLEQTHDAVLEYDDSVVELISSRCTNEESGARMVDAILTNTLLPAVSREVLGLQMEGETIDRITVGTSENKFEYSFG